MKKILFLLIFSIIFFNIYSQDISKINVDNLSDENLRTYVKKINSNGYTIEQAISIAKIKGMSNLQANKLVSRIRKLNIKNTDEKLQGKNLIKGELINDDDNLFFGLTTNKNNNKQQKNRLFGYDFFNNPNITFTPNLNVSVPDNYIIGYGDVISIDLWGATEVNIEVKVNRQGSINISGIGYINVIGLPLIAAKSKIKNQLKKIYSGINNSVKSYNKIFLAITIKEVRNVQINISGEVKVPGSYSLNGLSTVLNSLYAAGGPTKNGTFRKIKLFRGGKNISNFDIYHFLLNGSEKGNIIVQDQDVIIVKPYDKLVVIEGSVKRPGAYELLKGETLTNLLSFCGGFKSDAYKQSIVIKRVDGIQKEIIEVVKSDFSNVKLKDGDHIKINTILNKYSNKVSISGAVFQPGYYQFKKGLSLSKLLKKAEGYTKDAFLERGIIIRGDSKFHKKTLSFNLNNLNDNLLLKENDSIHIYSKENLFEKEFITINGAVNKPNKFDFMQGMRVEDLIAMAGGFKDGADPKVIDVYRRLKDGSYETISKSFNISVNSNLKELKKDKFTLNPFDIVSVRYLKGYTKQKEVFVKGEVNFPGSYSIGLKNESISDLIKQAGGLTKYAYIEGAYLMRKNNKIDDLKQFGLIKNMNINDSTDIDLKNMKKKYFKIGIDFKKIISRGKNSKYDLILKEGDELFVPSEKQTVRVEGEILSPSLVRYQKGRKFKHYIQNSGGFTDNAKRSKSYVIYANGDIQTTKSFLFFKIYPTLKPGAIILVPKKIKNKSKLSLQELLSITTGLGTLGLIIQSLIK